jgi:hypothetical protein
MQSDHPTNGFHRLMHHFLKKLTSLPKQKNQAKTQLITGGSWTMNKGVAYHCS